MKKIFAVFLCIFSIFLFSDVYAENKNVTIDSFRECPAYTLLYQFFPKDTGKSKVK